MLRGFRVSLVVGLLLPAVALFAAWRWWSARPSTAGSTLQAWHTQLAALDDDSAETLLRRAGNREASGLPVLVAGLATRREPLVNYAKRRLVEVLNHWTLLDTAEVGQQRVELAELLAAEVDQCDAAGQRAAIDLATRLLTESAGTADSPNLLTACEKVLQSAQAVPTVPRVAASISAPARAASVELTPTKAQASPSMLQPQSLANPASVLPATLPPLPTAVVKPATPPENRTNNIGPESFDGSRPTSEPPALQPAPDRPDTHANHASTSRGSSVAPPASLLTLPLIELLDAWHDVPLSERPTIEHELRRRGVTRRQIEIGIGLTSPDITERRHWVERLPRLPEIDPKPWLVWLSRDEHAEIRLAALQIMATTGTPEFQRRAGEMALNDADDQVRELAQRVSRGVEAATIRR